MHLFGLLFCYQDVAVFLSGCDRLHVIDAVGDALRTQLRALVAKIHVRLAALAADQLGSFAFWRHTEILAAIRTSKSAEEIPECLYHRLKVLLAKVIPGVEVYGSVHLPLLGFRGFGQHRKLGLASG